LTIAKIRDDIGNPFSKQRTSIIVQILKFITGRWLGIVVILQSLSQRDQERQRRVNSIRAGLIVCCLLGFIGVIIPTFTNNIINYV
jgi:preprotein translocase subunit YajC